MTLVAFLIGLPMLKSEVAFNAVASISVSPMLLNTSQAWFKILTSHVCDGPSVMDLPRQIDLLSSSCIAADAVRQCLCWHCASLLLWATQRGLSQLERGVGCQHHRQLPRTS